MFKLVFAAALLGIIFGTMYVVGQQILRMDANDPQIQLAEDFAARLQSGAPAAQIIPPKTQISSLTPFLIVYDKNKQEVASSGTLDGQTLQLPTGVLDNTTPEHGNRLTWQPYQNTRIAVVVVATNGNYVLAGRNLREVEKREDIILKLAALGWFVSITAVCLTAGIRHAYSGKRHKQ